MWRTPFGERVLEGAEGRLFRDALVYLVDYVEMAIEADDGDSCSVGVMAFDDMSAVQQMAMLEAVGLALLRRNIAAPAHTAVNEATIAAVYAHLLIGIEGEIDGQ